MSYPKKNLMDDTFTENQHKIVELLRRRPELTVPELIEQLEVPVRSVQRDLKGLVSAGLVVRSHDRVALPSFGARLPRPAPTCAMCGCVVPERSSFTIINRYAGIIWACCAHCGLHLLDRDPPVDIAFTRDFIQERTVDARDAIYLVASRVPTCCAPSIISFANVNDARGFQLGFGGTLMSLIELQAYLQQKLGTYSQDCACENC